MLLLFCNSIFSHQRQWLEAKRVEKLKQKFSIDIFKRDIEERRAEFFGCLFLICAKNVVENNICLLLMLLQQQLCPLAWCA